MRKHRTILNAILLVLFLGVRTPQFAQDPLIGPGKANQERRQHAIGLLRTINTAEVMEPDNYGSYASWQTLLAHQPKFFDEFISRSGPQLGTAHFADMPEILPGWNLRLNVHADGQGYDVLLQDMTDIKCAYAALTDERGVIRQSKAIDCEI